MIILLKTRLLYNRKNVFVLVERSIVVLMKLQLGKV
jgi:hypothetical protein